MCFLITNDTKLTDIIIANDDIIEATALWRSTNLLFNANDIFNNVLQS